MKPFSWPTWVRVMVFISLLWALIVIIVNLIPDHQQPTLFLLSPIYLFWGVAWIVHGVKNPRAKRIFIKSVVAVTSVILLMIIGIGVYSTINQPSKTSFEDIRPLPAHTLPSLEEWERQHPGEKPSNIITDILNEKPQPKKK